MMRVPATLMRGGNSRGLVFHRRDLPDLDKADLYAFFARCVGSPDPGGRQVDGVGGGTVTTSKIAVVGPPSHPEATVDYDYFQVRVHDGRIDRVTTCGNLTSAVARFSVEEALVPPGSTRVVLHDTNTGGLVAVQLGEDPRATTRPVTASVAFLDPSGRVTGRLLPTGEPTDHVETERGQARVTLIDLINPAVVVDAASIGVSEPMPRDELESDVELMTVLDLIRRWGAVQLGLAGTEASATEQSPFIPVVGLAFNHLAHNTADGVRLPVRLLSGGTAHHALPLGAALATAATVTVQDSVTNVPASGNRVELEHPAGTLAVVVVADSPEPRPVTEVSVELTTRRIMEGYVLTP